MSVGIFDLIGSLISSATKQGNDKHEHGFINYGKQKKGGGHDHRYNTEDDRTPAQKEGDKKRRK